MIHIVQSLALHRIPEVMHFRRLYRAASFIGHHCSEPLLKIRNETQHFTVTGHLTGACAFTIAIAGPMAIPELSRVAVIKCVALADLRCDGCVYKPVASVSVKVHEQSMFTSLVETVTLQTQRHAAIWQDAANWKALGGHWSRNILADTRFHLVEVFSMAKQFCECGVRGHVSIATDVLSNAYASIQYSRLVSSSHWSLFSRLILGGLHPISS